MTKVERVHSDRTAILKINLKRDVYHIIQLNCLTTPLLYPWTELEDLIHRQGPGNTHGLKITEEQRYCLCLTNRARPSCDLDENNEITVLYYMATIVRALWLTVFLQWSDITSFLAYDSCRDHLDKQLRRKAGSCSRSGSAI